MMGCLNGKVFYRSGNFIKLHINFNNHNVTYQLITHLIALFNCVYMYRSRKSVDFVTIPNFRCVKGNDPRSFSFTIKTTQNDSAGIISTGNAALNEGFTVGIGFGNPKFVKAGLVSGVVGTITPQ